MKKFSLSIAFALFIGAIAYSPVKAQDQDAKGTLERTWYATCYTEKPKNEEKCYQLSKELKEKFPDTSYIKNVTGIIEGVEKTRAYDTANNKFQAALKAYYAAPDAGKVDQLFAAGEELLKVVPGNQYVVGQMALAGAHGSLGQIYKNYDKVKGYGTQALQAFEPTTPPENWKADDWNDLRTIVMAQINQFLGYALIETKGDKEQAIAYLTKATQVKGKENIGWKDPNNYWLRAGIYQEEYSALRKQYDALPTDELKNGDQGKALLKQVSEVIDTKLIPDYARVIATATKPEAKSLLDAAKPTFDSYWKYRTNAPEKSAEYVRAFSADPTVAGPAIPVKADDSSSAALDAPAGTAQKATMVMGGAPGSTPATTNGAKATTTKAATGKAAPAKKAKAKKRRP
ncbi:MAG: hypothetical protein ABI977_03560 [Acidobacteriota bacterium]